MSKVISHPVVKAIGVIAIALTVANCSSGKMNKYGVKASPRVVADGQPVPKGGGRYQVGKPYVVAGRTYYPNENPNYSAVGIASWYGSDFHGRLTANGEVFDKYAIAAAHPTMPLPSYARVTNLENNRSMIVRVNDRGPFHANRVMDVSKTVADALGFKNNGTAKVKVDYVGKASLNGSDDKTLMATLRQDGMPAQLRQAQPTMLANAEPQYVNPVMSQPQQNFQRESQLAFNNTAPIIMGDVPLPPQRPYALGGHMQQNAQMAELYYSEPQKTDDSLEDGPFASMSSEGFKPLKK
ncbi:septal ring lytic transglycosylase RlpA family protein [Microvirga sp. W0021]|uniref:Endolytic peptidoglycan transglycosylase RlpA n=1 Tax=Hohaiivirga grylli TaxID=3133970 RepID=A0ABV0BMU4_9HYPH